MRPGTLPGGTQAARSLDEDRPSPNTYTGEGSPALLSAEESQSGVNGSQPGALTPGARAEGDPAALCPTWELEDLELGQRASSCLGTENDFGYFIARAVVTARSIEAGYFAAVIV